jgi:hypothetical protein
MKKPVTNNTETGRRFTRSSQYLLNQVLRRPCVWGESDVVCDRLCRGAAGQFPVAS